MGRNLSGAAAVENHGPFFKKLNMELPYDLAIPLRGVHPEELVYERCVHLFTTAKM